jgi:hypothetical protein
MTPTKPGAAEGHRRLSEKELDELANWRDDEEARGWVRGHVRRLLAEVRELRATASRRGELLRRATIQLQAMPLYDLEGRCIGCGRLRLEKHDGFVCEVRGVPDFIEELGAELSPKEAG